MQNSVKNIVSISSILSTVFFSALTAANTTTTTVTTTTTTTSTDSVASSKVVTPVKIVKPAKNVANENKTSRFPWQHVIALTGGASTAMNLEADTNYTVGFQNYDFSSSEKYQVRGMFGAFLGIEWSPYQNWLWQTGLAYYQTSPFGPSGTLTQDAGMDTPGVYQYDYKITNSQYMWENKFLTHWGDKARPYISLGLGFSVNEASDFSTNANPYLVYVPSYENQTERSFSYSLGFGVDYDILDELRLGIGYRFTDLGKAALGDGTLVNTPISHDLQQDQLYAQEVVAQLTYLIK